METDVQGCSGRRKGRVGLALALGLGAAFLASGGTARAAGALGTPGIEPIEERVAIAIAPTQTTLWTSLSFDGAKGKLAVVLPLPSGTALDTSSRAFFEALEVATAPRVIPPSGARSVCQGAPPSSGVAIEEDLSGSAALAPVETVSFPDASSLEAWATANGLVVAQSMLMALATFGPETRFVAMRYDVPGGQALTQTLRAVVPAAVPVLPLLLTSAKSTGLRVITWEIGAGRSQVQGNEVEIDLDNLAFDLAKATSNYGSLRNGVLVDGQQILVESASHEALRDNLPVGSTSESVTSFVKTYFGRAKTYGDATGDDIACTFQSAVALGKSSVVATACPRADLGFVDMGGTCQETVGTGQIDPATLRCGGASDDLALMLSGLVGSDAWLTRSTLVIPAGKMGADLGVQFPGGQRVDPIYAATSVDLSGCGGGSSSSSTGTSTGSGPAPTTGAGSGMVTEVPLYRYSGCSCNGAYDQVGTVEVDSTDAPSGYYESSSGCSTDTSTYSSTPDSCSGDTSTSGDTCGSSSGSSTSSDSCSNSDGSSGCSGSSGTGSDSCSSGSSDGCSSSGSSDGCGGSSGSSNDCAIAGGKGGRIRRFTPRLSGLVYGMVILLAPLRRLTRSKPRRNGKRRRKS